jgi:Holliday junction resolvase RusA-like endonuclease
MVFDQGARAWSFHVLGEPAPQGSKSAKGYRGGHIVLVESSKLVAPWRGSVTAAAFGAGPCLDGPLVVGMVFALRRPASARKRDTAPYRYPDLSKLARSTEDAITAAGLWADDARVAAYAPLVKAFAGWPAPGLDNVMVPVPGALVACAELGPGAFRVVAGLLTKEATAMGARAAWYSA